MEILPALLEIAGVEKLIGNDCHDEQKDVPKVQEIKKKVWSVEIEGRLMLSCSEGY